MNTPIGNCRHRSSLARESKGAEDVVGGMPSNLEIVVVEVACLGIGAGMHFPDRAVQRRTERGLSYDRNWLQRHRIHLLKACAVRLQP